LIPVELVDYPKPWLLFQATACLSLGYMAFAFLRKWYGWARGMREPTAAPGDHRRPLMIWLAEVLFQRQLLTLSFSRWCIHLMIFYGFIGLALLPAAFFILKTAGYFALSSTFPRFSLHPEGYFIFKLWGDSFGLLLLLGLIMAGIRRLTLRTVRETSNQGDVILLGLLLSVTLSGFVLEGLRLSPMPAEIAHYSYVGRFFSPPGTYTLEQLRPWLTACWTLHALLVFILFAYLPHSKLLHSLLAPFIIGMNAAGEHTREDIYWPEMKKYRATRSRQG